jgi:hypothetical protein
MACLLIQIIGQNFAVNEGQVRIRHTKPEIYRWHCSGEKNLEHRSGHILSALSLYQRYFCIV